MVRRSASDSLPKEEASGLEVQVPIYTVIVDGGTLFREGVARILSRSRFRVVGKFSSIAGLAEHARTVGGRMAEGERLLFVVGLAMDPTCGETPDLTWIKQQYPTARLVVLSDDEEPHSLSAVLQCGADGFLRKTITCDALIKSLDVVILGICVVSERSVPLLMQLAPTSVETHELEKLTPATTGGHAPCCEQTLGALSDRETKVLAYIAKGEPNKSIARKFDITEATVKAHVKAILRKLRAKNRTEAAIWANKHLKAGAGQILC
jgi:two-component system, NarL family, nitrate/nitrite response regulator NarL